MVFGVGVADDADLIHPMLADRTIGRLHDEAVGNRGDTRQEYDGAADKSNSAPHVKLMT